MTIREFFKKIVENNIDLNMELTVEIKGQTIASGFVDVYTDMKQLVLTQYEEEPAEVEDRDDFFLALAEEVEKSEAEQAFDDMMGGIGEMLDSMKINGVQ